jgi:site-specific recombinase XerD
MIAIKGGIEMGELVQLKQKYNVVMDWLERYKSERTIETYKYSVKEFFDCEIENISDWKIKSVKAEDAQKYIKDLFNDGKSDNTIETRKAALSSLFEYCIYKKIINENVWVGRWMKGLMKLNNKEEDEEYGKSISKEEIIELLNRIDNKYERLLIGIMFKTGVRVSEVIEIEYDDIKKKNGSCWLKVIGKRRRVRFIPIKEDLVREIDDYMRCYKIEGKLFSIGTRQVDRILKKWIDLSCHDCRRSFAMNYINNGGILIDLQRILGHKKLETTRRYLIEYERFNKRMGDVIDW